MYSIGPSSYGDLKGVDQLIATDRMAQQFWSVKVDFDAWMIANGRTGRLSANEGYRPEERCYYLWDNRTALGIVVAPPLTSRHFKFPNAIDFGITEPMGMNRALSPDEFSKLHEIVQNRGGTWTGVKFGEPWHHEMATRAEVYPPYPNARAIAENQEEEDMTPEQDARQRNIESLLVQIRDEKITQLYDRMVKTPPETASAVWKYGIPDTKGTKTTEARKLMAYIDSGKAAANLDKIADAVAAAITTPEVLAAIKAGISDDQEKGQTNG